MAFTGLTEELPLCGISDGDETEFPKNYKASRPVGRHPPGTSRVAKT